MRQQVFNLKCTFENSVGVNMYCALKDTVELQTNKQTNKQTKKPLTTNDCGIEF